MANYTRTNTTWSATSAASVYAEAYREFECGIHDLKYKSFRPGCPVCDLERRIQVIRDCLEQATNELRRASDQVALLRTQVDMVDSVREAMRLLNEDDTEFLKTSFYRWRDDKSVAVKPWRKAREAEKIYGFLVIQRQGPPFTHACTSVGGLAIAEYLDEAINTYGQPKGMQIMTRALSPLLPGSMKENDHEV